VAIADRRPPRGGVLLAALTFCAASSVQPAAAQSLFEALFGGGSHRRAPEPQASSYAEPSPFYISPRPSSEASGFGHGTVYCVRTCDGRYFPIAASDNASRAASCNSFCPASETRLVFGSNIDSAATETGKPYSELPNAFRYRNEMVAGCTCNGKDQIGLAPVRIEDDPTLRKGDIVAAENGLQVVGRSDKRGASLNFSPASDKIRARYERVPVVAQE
jgi:hypothetical protein